ncbi:hypothetical protein [Streptomyces sp. NPDC046759]|uniref:hypothetical protein n=1 Tax=Streptomyces sp. NPDC046759 TaxID=3155019 RepID=UPI0033FBB954
MITMETTDQQATTAPLSPRSARSAHARLYVLANGNMASVQHDGRWYLLNTGPEAKTPVLRLAGDVDDAALEPHICRSID